MTAEGVVFALSILCALAAYSVLLHTPDWIKTRWEQRIETQKQWDEYIEGAGAP
jgi:hypothetical protein